MKPTDSKTIRFALLPLLYGTLTKTTANDVSVEKWNVVQTVSGMNQSLLQNYPISTFNEEHCLSQENTRSLLQVVLMLCISLLLFISPNSWANGLICKQSLEPPSRLQLSAAISESFPKEKDRFLDLEPNDVLEGSFLHGGIQPNYQLNIDHKVFDPLRKFTRNLKNQDIEFWDKVGRLVLYIQSEVFPNRAYDDPSYLSAISAHSNKLDPIPLSHYAQKKAGVCREQAIVLHFALKWLGIDSRYLYIYESQEPFDGQKKLEDHAVVILLYDGELRVADSYDYLIYHSHHLERLFSEGIHQDGHRMDGLKGTKVIHQQFLSINPFPRVLKSNLQ